VGWRRALFCPHSRGERARSIGRRRWKKEASLSLSLSVSCPCIARVTPFSLKINYANAPCLFKLPMPLSRILQMERGVGESLRTCFKRGGPLRRRRIDPQMKAETLSREGRAISRASVLITRSLQLFSLCSRRPLSASSPLLARRDGRREEAIIMTCSLVKREGRRERGARRKLTWAYAVAPARRVLIETLDVMGAPQTPHALYGAARGAGEDEEGRANKGIAHARGCEGLHACTSQLEVGSRVSINYLCFSAPLFRCPRLVSPLLPSRRGAA